MFQLQTFSNILGNQQTLTTPIDPNTVIGPKLTAKSERS
jgi:hypothetical protein